MLFEEHNLALTLTGLLGIGVRAIRIQRWSIIWYVLIGSFLTIMCASNRAQSEYYLLPIMPALWLLGSQAIAALSDRRPLLMVGGLICVAALPLIAVVRQDVEWTKPDSRVVAKKWIEANIPSGAKILMDGFQYRFVSSPPLTPDKFTVRHQVAGVARESERFRGVSPRTMALYVEAMSSVDGPTYQLESTVWGLAVEDPDYYVQRCFDYIITSSSIAKRYEDDTNRQRFPKSAQFYRQLKIDPRFQKIYFVEPVPWQRPGPIITVYKVIPQCEASLRQNRDSTAR
jgi:hypothetical protein